MKQLIMTIDAVTQVAMHGFALTIILIIVVGQRAKAKNPVEPEPRGRWGKVNALLLWPHREYALRKKNHLLIWINLVCAALTLLGFILMPLLAVLSR